MLLLYFQLFLLVLLFRIASDSSNAMQVYLLGLSIDVRLSTNRLSICDNQRPADAVADFLLDQGLHTVSDDSDDSLIQKYQPIEDLYLKYMQETCSLLSKTMFCNATARPRDWILRNYRKLPVAGILNSSTLEAHSKAPNVYLRQGYTGTALARCACAKMQPSCGFKDFLAIERHLEEYVAASVKVDSLLQLQRCGFEPAAVLDVGANIGQWAYAVSRVFPDAVFLLLEANEAHEERLQATGHAFEITLVGNSTGSPAKFYRRPGTGETHLGTGDSMFRENTKFYEGAEEMMLPMQSLDDIALKWKQRAIAAAVDLKFSLLKLDLQGAELMALQGAREVVLRDAEVVYSEVRISNYNEHAPLFFEVYSLLQKADFELYDIADISRSNPDADGLRRIIDFDVIFVRKASALWERSCTTFPNREEFRRLRESLLQQQQHLEQGM